VFILVKDTLTLKNKFPNVYNFISDEEERTKIIKSENLVLIILKEFGLQEKSFYFRSFFILWDKKENKIYSNTSLIESNVEIKSFEEFLFILLENLYKKLDNSIDKLSKFFEKLLKNHDFEIDDLFFILTSTDVLEKVIKENNNVIKKILDEFELKNEFYLKEDYLQLETEVSFLNNEVENLMDAYSIYYNMKTSKLLDKISIIAFLFLIPSTIFAMYGMNFKHIPLYDYPMGFILVSIVSYLSVILLYYFIKKRYNL
jgi:Mg2+ and Co2+ transporter CorA